MGVTKEFDGYILRRLIGKGGMGEVYLAHDSLLDRPVAVKFISSMQITRLLRERFLLEARAIARLQHPNVVTIHRVGEVDDRPYIVYEFVRGQSLDHLPRPVAPELCLKIALDIASGLAAANRQGIIHRDIKPGNAIMSEDGEIKLLDFGLAKMLEPPGGGSAPRDAPKGKAAPAEESPRTKAAPPQKQPPEQVVSGKVREVFDPFSATRANRPVRSSPPPASVPGHGGTVDLAETADLSHLASGKPAPGRPALDETMPPEQTGASRPGQHETADVSPSEEGRSPMAETMDPGLPLRARLQLVQTPEPTPQGGSNPDAEQTMDAGLDLSPPAEDDLVPLSRGAGRASGEFSRGMPSSGIMGTPEYMAPELWRGEPANFRSDIYSFGALMFTLGAGRPPHQAPSIFKLRRKVLQDRPPPLEEVAVGMKKAGLGSLCAVVDRCLHRDPQARYASANELHQALAKLLPDEHARSVPEGNPYRGLHAFEAEHQDLFFGRDAETRAVLERLKVEAFVLVAGDSGAGKSSFCRAGVIPRLPEQFTDKRQWQTITMVPGRHPVRTLALNLAPLLSRDVEELEQAMLDDPGGLARKIRVWPKKKRGLVLFIDQLEELETISDGHEADAVAELLGWLSEPSPGVKLLATARGDFLSRLVALPRLGSEISRAIYLLSSLSGNGIREAVVGPAEAKGVAFESEVLVAELVQSTLQAGGGGLPLLQFALAELWQARDPDSEIISEEELSSIGGVAGALDRHADSVLARMLPPQRQAARRVLTRLVTVDGTRAHMTSRELDADQPDTEAALAALVQGRLVVARDDAEGTGYEIAHEALINGWKTLAGWLTSDAEARRVQENLKHSMDEWERLDRSREVLWSPVQLDEAGRIPAARLSAPERAFLSASRRGHRRKKMIRFGVLLLILIISGAVYGVVQYQARAKLNKRVQQKLAQAAQGLRKAQVLGKESTRLRRMALVRFDGHDVKSGEKLWSDYLEKISRLTGQYRAASQLLETAMLMDLERKDVRRLLANVLYERMLVAEALHQKGELDELFQRLTLYDEDGARRRQWAQPARLTLEVSPPGARVTLAWYVLGKDRRHRLQTVSGLLSSARELAPGSYLATLEGTGLAKVHYPFVIGRGERLTLKVRLPEASAVPEGFVLVPAGRFLFGSAAEDNQRKDFFHHVPLHQVHTGAYLIARTETTFAQWLEYLRSLPAEERKARAPAVGKGGFKGALALRELPDGAWEMSFQPTSRSYQARSGRKIMYQSRRKRAAQSWLRMPVVGVTVADARGYVAWLSSSGRVPNARLCTEHEWERGARGADGREYPHGESLGPDEANYDDTYGKVTEAMGPDEVGTYPGSASPFGLLDTAGNVWEWTRSSVEPDKYAARGGSWAFGANSSRTTDRELTEPSFKDVSVGLRVCADFPEKK